MGADADPPLPNLRHLAVFRAVVRLGGVSAAARALHVTQPAVTQAVAGLEAMMGAPLLARGHAGTRPTPAGTACDGRIGRALEQLAGGLAEAGAARGRGSAEAPLRAITATQLDALVRVVEDGGFAPAARRAGRSRATLHRAVRELERAAGVALFERTSFGLRPTREAERLARRVGLARAELEQARAEAATLAGTGSGATVVGAMPLARSGLVPAALLDFAARRPEHGLSILDGPYESMLAALRHGRADVLVGALRDDPPGDVHQEPLFEDPLALVVRAGHPLARRRAPRARDLRPYPWIVARAGTPLRRRAEELRAAAGADLLPAPIECNSLVAARALLAGSDRVMLSSAQQVRRELATGELVTLPHPLGHVVRPIGLAWRRDWRPTPVQAELLAALRRAAASQAT